MATFLHVPSVFTNDFGYKTTPRHPPPFQQDRQLQADSFLGHEMRMSPDGDTNYHHQSPEVHESEIQVLLPSDGINDSVAGFHPTMPTVDNENLTDLSHCKNLSWAEIFANYSECQPELPRDLYFTGDNAVSVAAYSCLFIVAACGNLTVFITLFRNRHVKSRINTFIMHLAVADLIVTFMELPLEITWHSTVAWKAGDLVCRVMMFFRALGFYLSSCILVSISADRYFAIMRPLSISGADTRSKVMLIASWVISIVFSTPQCVIFHVERHPVFQWFEQCVTFKFFPSQEHELAYNLFSFIALYGLPLAIITSAYSVILCRISKKTRQSRDQLNSRVYEQTGHEKPILRRSGVGNIERARSRTLKMTLVIVGAYVMCWTPYFVISVWYYVDKETAVRIDNKVQRGLFLFAVSNSCINPLVYGMFTPAFRRDSKRLGSWIKNKFRFRQNVAACPLPSCCRPK